MIEDKMIFQIWAVFAGLVAHIGVLQGTSRARDCKNGQMWKIVSLVSNKFYKYSFVKFVRKMQLRARRLFLPAFAFHFFPHGKRLFGALRFHIPKHMRVAVMQFVIKALDDIINGKQPLFFGNLRMQKDL